MQTTIIDKKEKHALVLTGGGARGAYQAGALYGLNEILGLKKENIPFSILTGNSAGAINACFLAAHADNFHSACKRLRYLWRYAHSEQIYKLVPLSLAKRSLKWITEFSSKQKYQEHNSYSLLDTAPLYGIIQTEISLQALERHIQDKRIQGIAISAISYANSVSKTFFQGDDSIQGWERSQRKGIRAQITHKHILASASIPLLFPPVFLDNAYYGDGSIRNHTPLSPAIKMGADKIFVIGVRKAGSNDDNPVKQDVSIARIINVLLNSFMLDAVELDLERLEHINMAAKHHESTAPEAARNVEHFLVQPSEDIGTIATEEAKQMPHMLRILFRKLGANNDVSDLLSYLLFEPSFTQRLVELGYKDVMNQETEIRKFLS